VVVGMSTSGESDKTENKKEIRGKILFLIEFFPMQIISQIQMEVFITQVLRQL